MLWVSWQKQEQLDHPIIKKALNTIRENQEAVDQVGTEFKIRTNLMSIVPAKIQLDTPYGEARFQLRSVKGDFDIVINTSSHTLESIENSSNPHQNKAKFYIPEKKVADRLAQTESVEELKKVNLDPKTSFASIDFISLTKGASNSLILKPSNSELIGKELPRKTLYDLAEEKKVELSEPPGISEVAKHARVRKRDYSIPYAVNIRTKILDDVDLLILQYIGWILVHFKEASVYYGILGTLQHL